ncbi:MAG: ABC transporter ATP-binding protein [Caldilineaceae bacterium]|nr:ABC transporter ATP-binding protein [Caldilineaceae bacterium]
MHIRRGWRAVVGNTTTRSLRSVDRATVSRVWSFAKPHGAGIALVLLVVTAQSLVGLLPPLFYRHFIDTILPDKDLRLLVTFSAYLLALPVATVLLGLVQQLLIVRIGETLVYDLRNAMFDHVQQLSMRFFTSTRAGEIVARFTQDVEGARRMLTGTLPQLMTAFVTLVSTLVVMMQLEWRLTLPGLLLFPALWPFAWWMARLLRPIHHKTMEHNANLSSMVNETLSVNGASLMKLFGQQVGAGRQFRSLADLVREFRIRLGVLSYWLTSSMGILSGLGTALFYGFGGWLVFEGRMTEGTIVAFVAYLPRLYQPISMISHVPTETIQGVVSFERVFAYMDQPVEIKDRSEAVDLPAASGRLEFRDVTFDYHALPEEIRIWQEANPEQDAPVRTMGRGRLGLGALQGPTPKGHREPSAGQAPPALQDLSFTVEPGQMVALVGLSGAGKSTVINLVMRLYDPTRGSILLDGHDLRDLSLQSLSRCIGMVTQHAYLFHDSLRANLLYAQPEASDEQVQDVCERAQLREFIDGLPDGLDTVVGERGYRLSGGEQQRVSIARVLLKQPSLLILDEATSHLDSHSEYLLQHALEPLFVDNTSLVIAHRLSTVRNADTILVLDKGRLVEVGSHDDLVRDQGLYSHLCALQFRGPTPTASISVT